MLGISINQQMRDSVLTIGIIPLRNKSPIELWRMYQERCAPKQTAPTVHVQAANNLISIFE